jgi:hypothetical protein
MVSAQDPSAQPLIQFANLNYVGTFRLPRASINGDDLSFGGRPFAFNPARNSLFVGSHTDRVAEVSIPSLVSTTDVNRMFFASYLQGLVDPLEGNIWQVATSGAEIEGLVVDGDKLVGTGSIYYDAQNTQRVSHYSRSTNLSAPSFSGFVPVWQTDHQGFVSGFMSMVPPEWQAKLGGRAITGQCCTPIAWKTSWGPAAFAFNPSDIGVRSPVPATPLLYYTDAHPTLGEWSESGAIYGGTARVDALVIIGGTRTALYFGSIGTGTPCYGNGTSNQSLDHTPSPDGTLWCYDPTSTDKGQHAYPYHYQIWAYDLNEFAAVKEGRKNPWDVVPYGVWPFDLPTPEVHAKLGGVAYDPQRQMIYVSQLLADKDTFANRALIHALRIDGAPATLPPLTATTGPTPSGSGTVQSVVLSSDKAAPQTPGTTITWQATATGGISPYQYKWLTNDGTSWTSGPWTSSNTMSWTPTTASPYARVSVWVRSYGATPDVGEASTELYYPISGTAAPAPPPSTPPPTSRVTSVSLSANMAAPQPAGTTITWTATPTGGVAPYQYQWQTFMNGTSTASPWTTSNTFAWTPPVASEFARVAVWVRSAGDTANIYEASTEKYFGITAATAPLPPPSTTTTPTSKVTSVSIHANMAPPQPVGTTVTWTATPTGGVAPQQYQWQIYDGSAWTTTPWSTSNTYAWIPTTAHPYTRVSVWVRSAGSTANIYEASAEQYFATIAAVTPPPSPPPAPAPTAKVSSVGLSANKVAPQPTGTTITWTATAAGGVAPYQYQWQTFNGTSWTASSWSTSNTFNWTPTVANAYSRVAVWVRSAGSTSGIYEASTEQYFAVTQATVDAPPPPPPPAPTAKATSVTLTANMPAPQPRGTSITWTAVASGGVAPYQYKWMAFDGVSWTTSAWTTSNTYTWIPTNAHDYARVAVWVRSAGSTADNYEVSTEKYFAIK